MTVKPDPPPQVEVGRDGSGDVAASMLFQLFATQRSPAGSIDPTVGISMVPLWKKWMRSPGFVPAGWPFGAVPANITTPRPKPLATKTSSLPSIATPHGAFIVPP